MTAAAARRAIRVAAEKYGKEMGIFTRMEMHQIKYFLAVVKEGNFSRAAAACNVTQPSLTRGIRKLESDIGALPECELSLTESKTRDVVDQLMAGEIDVGLSCQPSYPDEVAVTPLYLEGYAVAFKAGHRFEELDEVPLDELVGKSYLERLNCEFNDNYATHNDDRSLRLNLRYSSEREDWVQAMLLTGLGISLVPEFLPLMPGIIKRPIVQPEMRREVFSSDNSRAAPVTGCGYVRPHCDVA